MKKIFSVLSVLAGVAGYVYMVIDTARGSGEGLSLTTFALWSALAWITGFTMLKQGANPLVPMIYGVGATATTVVLLLKGRFGFTMQDGVITALVISCVVLWNTKGAKWALILSVAAAVVAVIPFMQITWSDPANSPIIPNTAFLAANSLSFISAKSWKLEDRLYSGVNVIVCLLLVIPWLMA